MHELGMCEAILDAVLARAEGRRVKEVRLRIGVLHAVEEPALDMSFALVAEGTPAEGAAVDLVTLPVRATCQTCGWAGESDGPIAVCGACGAAALSLEGGDELVLESIRVASA